MTVEIELTNDKESVVIADVRVSGDRMLTDSFLDKIKTFKNEGKYHGIVFGTGNAERYYSISKNIENQESLEGLARNASLTLQKGLMQQVEQFVQIKRGKFDLLKAMYDDSDLERLKIDERKDTKFEVDRLIRDSQVTLQITGYNQIKNKLERFILESGRYTEIKRGFNALGSGSDAASVYLGAKLQGLDLKRLDVAELAFIAANAYAFANLNHGVGGTPNIAIIDKLDSRSLPVNITIPIVNLSGAYLSELSPLHANRDQTLSRIKDILSEKADMRKIAESLDLSEKRFTTTYIPYSSWQETANRSR